eukprot:353517-Chlamydomonas_euryale.AAC.1
MDGWMDGWMGVRAPRDWAFAIFKQDRWSVRVPRIDVPYVDSMSVASQVSYIDHPASMSQAWHTS